MKQAKIHYRGHYQIDLQPPPPQPLNPKQNQPKHQFQKPLNQSESKLIHLYNLAHSKIDSPFSKLYSLLYHKQEEQQTQTLPDSVLKKFCLKCGNLFIPGLTVSIRVVYTKQKIRKLRTRCLACRHSVFDDGLIQKQEKVEPIVKPAVVQSTNEENNVNNSKSKERRKRENE